MRIPYAQIVSDHREQENVLEATRDMLLTRGKFYDRFEREFSQWIGLQHCIFVNSGSSANLLAVAALTSKTLGERRLKPGDEVITVAAAFPTTVAPLVQYGLVPVFVDIDDTYNIDPAKMKAALSSKTKAVMLAHCLGNPFDIAAVKFFCEDNGLWLIEDNCDSLGSTYGGQKTGTFGDIGTSSFFPAHHMTTGEGGMVYTDNHQLARLVQQFRDWGRDCTCHPGQDDRCGARFDKQFGDLPKGYDHKYVYSEWGYNLKSGEIEAAIGCAQLEKLDSFVEARRNNWLTLWMGTLDKVTPQVRQHNSNPSWFGFLMAEDTMEAFEAAGVQARRLFAGNIVRHPVMQSTPHRVSGDLTNTDKAMSATWIGVGPHLGWEELSYMGSVL